MEVWFSFSVNQTPDDKASNNEKLILSGSKTMPGVMPLASSNNQSSSTHASCSTTRSASSYGRHPQHSSGTKSAKEPSNCQGTIRNQRQNDAAMVVDLVPGKGTIFSETSDPDSKVVYFLAL